MTFTCEGIGADYEIEITNTVTGQPVASSPTSTFTYTFAAAGEYTATCTVDGQTDPAECTQSVLVTDDEFPDVYVQKDHLSGTIVNN